MGNNRSLFTINSLSCLLFLQSCAFGGIVADASDTPYRKSLSDQIRADRPGKYVGIGHATHVKKRHAQDNAKIIAMGNLAKEIQIQILAVTERIYSSTTSDNFRSEIKWFQEIIAGESSVVLPSNVKDVAFVELKSESDKYKVLAIAQLDRLEYARSLTVLLDRRATMRSVIEAVASELAVNHDK